MKTEPLNRHERRKRASIERNDFKRVFKRCQKLKGWLAKRNIFVSDLHRMV